MKEKINVVFVVTACKKCGPIEQMLNIFRYLDRRHFNPILITIYDEPADGSSQLQKYLDIGVEHHNVKLSKLDIMLGRTKRLKEKLDEFQPCVVHSLGVFPNYALSKMNYPNHVTTLRNFIYDDYPVKFGKIKGFILAKLHLYAMKHTKKTWTCSENLAKKYRESLNLDFTFIQNGVDVDKFVKASESERVSLRGKLGLPQDKTILVYAGQFISRKDQKFLLSLFSEEKLLSNHVLLLLGGGDDYAVLKKKYGYLNNVIMTGQVSNVSEYLQASDIYISSSKSEGLPNGVLEAMATGLPVILSDIEQHKELFEADSKIGLLYKLGDKKDCLNKILAMDVSRREIAGEAAYRCAHNHFSAERMSKQYQDEYLKLYEGKFHG